MGHTPPPSFSGTTPSGQFLVDMQSTNDLSCDIDWQVGLKEHLLTALVSGNMTSKLDY